MLRQLNESEELNELFKSGKNFVLFIHSKTCPISANVYNIVINFINSTKKDIYLIIIQTHRVISDLAEQITGIKHESPQILIISRSNVTAHASHYNITSNFLSEHIKHKKGKSN